MRLSNLPGLYIPSKEWNQELYLGNLALLPTFLSSMLSLSPNKNLIG